MANLDSPQWKRAQQTSLWKRTLGSDDEDVKPLRESFLDARENAAFLLDKIRPDFPNLTIHDITHVDSLWTVADAIIGENYPINPLEGYVLGIVFLIHDAAMSYDAVGGKEKLRNTIEWKDAYADGPGDKSEEVFEKECDFIAIRAIHAREAKEIMGRTFSSNDIPSFHIVKKASYRQSLGEIIGRIAASHHWSIDEIESKLDIQITPSVEVSGPGNWDINEQKLACILRCADAGHIDDGRAPYYIFRSLNLNGVSLNHWKSQSRLGVVRPYIKDATKLLITSTSSFKKEDFAAWNVAYEAVKLFDEEIKKSNNLLKSIDEKLVFPRTGVMGASSKEELAEYIKTEGWKPCSFGVHTSNIKMLIENLGGSKLYGEDNMLLVAMRELIQNARDAIHARQKLDESFDNGKITIRLKEEGAERFLEVEDNGIGMSMDCIKYNLLDFGNSYWKSSLSKYENPGLRSKGFTSIGKFGIGFYSVFMVAKSVDVRTKRYDTGNKEAMKVEFPMGLTLSPIISKDEMNPSASTIIRFGLKDAQLPFNQNRFSNKTLSLEEMLPRLVASLDTDVFFERQEKLHKIHTNIYSKDFDKEKWLGDLFMPCPVNIKEIASKTEVLIDENGEQRGIILPPEFYNRIKFTKEALLSGVYYPCIQTIGGLLSMFNLNYGYDVPYIGYLNGKENSISRNKMNIDNSLLKCLQAWMKEKYLSNYDELIKSNKYLAYVFERLIVFCRLNDTIIDDNIRRIYAEKRPMNEVGTMKGLMNIHLSLSVGIVPHAGELKFSCGGTPNKNSLCPLFDSHMRVKNQFLKELGFIGTSEQKRKDINKLQAIIAISNLPATNYKEIIRKYCGYLNIRPFNDCNKRALGTWVNLMLDRLFGKMIDWRNVNERLLYRDPIKVISYLEPFLSSTYLEEMINNR